MYEDNTARLHIELLNLETKRRDYEKQVEESKRKIEDIKDEIINLQYKLVGGYQEELHNLTYEKEEKKNNNKTHIYSEGHGGTGGSKQEEEKEEHKIKDKDIFPKGIIHSGEEPHIYPHTYSGEELERLDIGKLSERHTGGKDIEI